jgi:hypothetical protein
MKKNLSCILLIFLAIRVFGQTDGKMQAPKDFAEMKIKSEVIVATKNTYGYNIYVDNKLLIHQQNIPGIATNEGFRIKNDALKVANLVIEKLKKGQMPPAISIDELKKLNVTY